MQNPIITVLSNERSIIRTRELNEQGITNYEISKLVAEGIIEKLYQGVYTLGDIHELELMDVNVVVENGVVSLVSAAFYYKLISGEEEGKITVTLNRDQKPPKIPYDLFSYYYTTSKFYNIGLNVIDQHGRKLKIYDLERTVCDIVRHRSKYDSNLLREVLENYLKNDQADIDKLLEYSKSLRIYNVMVQYLEILGGISVK